MDSVAALFDGPRARGAFLIRSVLSAPWAMRIEDEAPLTLVAVVEGEAWITLDDSAPVLVRRGDVAIARGPGHYNVADDPDTPTQVTILPGQICVTPDGQFRSMREMGVRNWGNAAEGSTVLVTGTYQMRREVSQRLLDALPALVTVKGDSWNNPMIGYLAEEIVKDEPGQEAVLDRLLDLLLIAVLREWFARAESDTPGWYRAHRDPIVGPALRLMQDDPSHRWTVASLGAATGVSRAALARRFNEIVGEPPMAFLTSWRLTLAADLLREPDETIGSIAHQVGYGSAFALSAAFKRVRGVSPQQYRNRCEGQYPQIA
jgi:AraC-like DNA-binding protein